MKTKQLFSFLVGLVLCATSCNNEEPPVPNDPSVAVEAGAVTTTSVEFTITSADADKVAYVVVSATQDLPTTDVVLSEGTEVESNKECVVSVQDLTPATEYVVAVAAMGGGKTAFDSINISTTDVEKNEIEFVGASAERLVGEEYAEGEFAVVFTDEAESGRLTVVFNTDDKESLPAGEYHAATDDEASTIVLAKSSLLMDDDNAINFDTANVVVEVDDEYNYTFAMEFTAGNDTINASFVGKIDGVEIPTPTPGEIAFTSASSVWGGADHVVTFESEDGNTKLKVDIYTYNPQYGYLDEGTYTVLNSGYSFKAGEIDYYYSKYTADGVDAILDAGTVEVAINDDFTYDITFDLVDKEGREIKTSYKGVIEGMSFENGFTWVAASRNKVENGVDGQFNITFKTAGVEYADYLTMDFYAEAGSETLPAGTYTVAEQTTAGNIDAATIVFTTFSNGSPIINGGSVVVEVDAEGNYNFAFDLKEKDCKRVWKCSYAGQVYDMVQKPAATEITFVSANGYYSDDSGETYVYLVADNGKQVKLGLLDLEWKSDIITSGHYTVGDGWSGGTITSGWYGVDWNDGISFKSGSADVENDGEGNYQITIDLTLSNDELIAGTFSGRIEGISPEILEKSAWSIVGSSCNWDPTAAEAMSVVDGYHVLYGATLGTTNEFKFIKDGSWDVNRGGVSASKPNHYYAATQGGGNIVVTVAGTYDIYLNEACDTYYIMDEGKLPSSAMEDAVYEVKGDFENNNWATGIVAEANGGYFVAQDVVFANQNNEGLQFKVIKNGVWCGTSASSAQEIHTAIELVINGGNNIDINGEVGVKYDIYIDSQSNQVWVMSDGCVPGDNIPSAEPLYITFTKATGQRYSNNNFGITLKDDDYSNEIAFDLYSLGDATDYVEAGNYIVDASCTAGTINPEYSHYKTGISVKLVSGSASIQIVNGEYAITFDVVDKNGVRVVGTYNGLIDGFTLPTDEGSDVEAETLVVASAEGRAYTSTNYGVQLLTPGSSLSAAGEDQVVQYINIDLYNLVSGIDYIYTGTYVAGGTASGEMDKAHTKIVYANYKEHKLTDGIATFTINDDNSYTIEYDMTFDDGKRYAGSYTGVISGINPSVN